MGWPSCAKFLTRSHSFFRLKLGSNNIQVDVPSDKNDRIAGLYREAFHEILTLLGKSLISVVLLFRLYKFVDIE